MAVDLNTGLSHLVERYEYSPYGERKVFVSAGANDPGCYAPTLVSKRRWMSFQEWSEQGYSWITTLEQPFGLCEFGHQGLPHEEEIDNGSMIQNRMRIRRSERWYQHEPAGYIDGMNKYQYVRSNSIYWVDPSGWQADAPSLGGFSGIGSVGANYVNRWLQKQLKYVPQNDLSGFSSLSVLDSAINTKDVLNGEFEKRQDLQSQFPSGKFCSGSGKTKIRILMLSPATTLRPSEESKCCCDIQGDLMYDAHDDALAYARIANTPTARNRQMQGWGNTTPVIIMGDIKSHGSAGVFEPNAQLPIVNMIPLPPDTTDSMFSRDAPVPADYEPGPYDYHRSPTGGNFSPEKWVRDHMDPSNPSSPGAGGYVFVCHSQGCNNLMRALNQACQQRK